MMTEQDPFKISDLVPDFEAWKAEYKVLSNAMRARYRSQLDIAYGEADREVLDLYFPAADETPRPIHMFVHGGYWRANTKEDYAFAAESVLAAGGIAAVIDYQLMPGTRMPVIVDEVRRAARWLREAAPTFGGRPDAISASGHSAGAHLAYYLTAKAPHETAFPETGVTSSLLISGIYDLRPITTSFLQEEIRLTAEEVADWSPFEAQPSPQARIILAVGHDESEPFHVQAQDLAFAAERRGLNFERITLPRQNHMSVVAELGRAESQAASLVRQTILSSLG